MNSLINTLISSFSQLGKDIVGHLGGDGFDTVAVGGCIRSVALGEIPRDIDIATNATEEQIIDCLKNNFLSVKRTEGHFPVILVSDGEETIEVASFRKEYGAGRFDKGWTYATLEEDLSRRDFTVNAMAVNLATFELIDPFNGMQDLKNKIIKTPIAAKETLKDDPMRVTRAFMFKHRLGFNIDQEILDYITTEKNIFVDGSGVEMTPERKKMEFEKGFKYAKSKINYVKDLNKYGLLEPIFDGLYINTKIIFETNNLLCFLTALLFKNDFEVRSQVKYLVETLKCLIVQ